MGAVVGAALAVGLPELLRDLQGAWLLAYAVATLAVVLWAPEGLAGLIDRLRGARPAPVAPPGLPDVLPAVGGPQTARPRQVSANASAASRRWPTCRCWLGAARSSGLIGPNGSGKTTLLNVINGLERADAGTIALDEPAHRAICRRPRSPAPASAAPSRPWRWRATRKMADLARAVATGAAFLLLDEPAAGAGDRERRELVDIVRRLRDAGRGVLIVDHDIELLSRVCDRLVCLDRGRVIASGRPAEVRADPRVRASFLGLDGVAA